MMTGKLNKQTVFFLLNAVCLTWFWISCKQKEVAEIEKIIVDEAFIKSQISGYDSLSIDSFSKNKNTETIYFFKDNATVAVYRDSLERIRAWFKKGIKDKRIDGAEVYTSTGQIMGKLNFVNGEMEGEVKYYYEDGRIKSKGVYKNGHRSGEWKNYDKDGKLISITN